MLVSRRVFSGVSCPSVGRQQLVHRCKQVQQRSMSVAVRASTQEGSQPSSKDRLAGLSRRLLVGGGLLSAGAAGASHAEDDERRGESVVRSDEEWRQVLSPGQYKILRQAGTELPRTSPLNNEKRRGQFVCAGCGTPVFSSEAKFNSGTGWPSFFEPLDGAVVETPDNSIFFMPRIEVRCKACGGHLGHVFDDGPPPTGLRYCMNGLAMDFKPAGAQPA